MRRSQTPFLTALALGSSLASGLAAQRNPDGSVGQQPAAPAVATTTDGLDRIGQPWPSYPDPRPAPNASNGLVGGGGDQAGPQDFACASLNGAGGSLETSMSLTNNVYFALRGVAPVPLRVVGFELLCDADAPVSLWTALYTAGAGGQPTWPPARTGTMGVQTTAGFRRTTFSTPLELSSGATFFLGLRTHSTGKVRAVLTSGTVAPYYFSGVTPPNWAGPNTSYPMAWRVVCQVNGEYVKFGAGCLGWGRSSGGSHAEARNANASATGTQTWVTQQFVHAVDIERDETIGGFSWLMSHAPGAITIDSYVYAATANGTPALNPLRQGKMEVTVAASWARTSFLPLEVKAGTRLYIGYKVPDASLRTDCGSFGEPSTYYWNGPAWSGPHTATHAAFRVHTSPAVALNPFATAPGIQTGWAKGAQFVHQVIARSDLWIDGFAFRCSASVPGDVPTYLYRALPDGTPAKTPLRTNTMAVAATQDWAETRFTRAFFAQGEKLFIGYKTPADGTFIVDSGANAELSTHFWGGPSTWSGPWTTARTGWRVYAAPSDGKNTDQETTTSVLAGAGYFAAGPFTASSSEAALERFSWLTSAATDVTVMGYVVMANQSGTPMDIAVRSSPMQIGTTARWHTCSFEPIAMLTGAKYYVVLQVPGTTVRLASAGGTAAPYFWSASAQLSWGAYSGRLAVKVYCRERAAPMLDSNGVPAIGSTFEVTLNGARPSTAAGLVLGASKTQWGPLPLPLGLGFVGAPECSLLTSYDMLLPVPPIGPSGNIAVPIAIPNSVPLVGARFYNQFLVYDPFANALKFVLSNGGAGRIGG